MRYPWLDEYLLRKPGVIKDLQPEWNWIRYKIGDKMFAAICFSDEGKVVYITLKLEPSEGSSCASSIPISFRGTIWISGIGILSVRMEQCRMSCYSKCWKNHTGWYWRGSAKRSRNRSWKEK